jgi:hypothetical protein
MQIQDDGILTILSNSIRFSSHHSFGANETSEADTKENPVNR